MPAKARVHRILRHSGGGNQPNRWQTTAALKPLIAGISHKSRLLSLSRCCHHRGLATNGTPPPTTQRYPYPFFFLFLFPPARTKRSGVCAIAEQRPQGKGTSPERSGGDIMPFWSLRSTPSVGAKRTRRGNRKAKQQLNS